VRLNWEEEEIIGPDVEKRETLLLLAKMANDAYVEPNDPAWYELPGEWNIVRLLYLRALTRSKFWCGWLLTEST
jgi:putative lipase involved disintegration of autophagic bodies